MDSHTSGTAQLIGIVSNYLRRDLRPEIEGRHAFLTLVAANLLDALARDLEQGGKALEARTRGLAHLLGHEGREADLSEDLCRRIVDGQFDETTPGLLDHLLETTLDRLAIDQPGYAAYRLERGL